MGLKHGVGGIAAVAVAVAAVIGSACGGHTKQANRPTTTASSRATTSTGISSSSTSASTSTGPSSPSTSSATPTTAGGELWTAVWPAASGSVRYHDPVTAARTFAVEYLHFVRPVVGAFQQGDSRSGEVPIRPTSNGPLTTIAVRQLGADASWWVVGAATPNINVTEPPALATITSPVALRGTSTAFEATVQVSIREDGGAAPLAEGYVMGGANGRMGPFSATLPFARPTSPYGAIVFTTVSAADGNVWESGVIRVRFAA